VLLLGAAQTLVWTYDNYDKLESVQPQEVTLTSTLQFGINFFVGYT